jgi:hypothetical protein
MTRSPLEMKPTVSEVRRENARRALLSFRRSRQGQPSSSFIGGLQAASKLGQGLPGTLGKGKAEGAGMEIASHGQPSAQQQAW